MLIHDPPKLATQARPSWRTALGILVCVRVLVACVMTVSYTHLTLPTTPYV